jgi:hypothetical protein
VVVSDRGLQAGTLEYRQRSAEASDNLTEAELLTRLAG